MPFGYHVLSDWRLKHWPLADHLRRLFEVQRIDLVLDVGANAGQYHDFLRLHVGYEGPIESFEPIPDLAQQMQARSSADTKWSVHGCALGRTTEMRQLNVMRANQWSSFLPPEHEGATQAVVDANSVEVAVSVQVRTLQEVWPELVSRYGRSVRPFLKLDTQGFDLEVLAGAQPVLDSVPAAQSEVYFRRLYKGAPTYTDALEGFARYGYQPTGIFANTRETTLALRDCDVTFTRA